MRKTDPRVIRTRKQFSEAMVRLIHTKDYDTITIKDIADESGLRRATFYLHYRDKEELLFYMLRETFAPLIEEFKHIHETALTDESETMIDRKMFQHASENADLYRAILRGHGSAIIARYIREYLEVGIRERFATELDAADLPLPIEALANYTASVKLNMIMWWLEEDMPYDVDHMARMCAQLTLYGATGIVESASAL